jgi:hypothetical protein
MAMEEERVKIDGDVRLGATVTCPDRAGKSPAIVIVMGTGKMDRDGNGSGFEMNIYRDLAQLFGEWGFVSIRYDKRGTHESEGDFNRAGLFDLVDDAASVVRYVKSLPYVDESKVIVCGHSEGCMIATLVPEKEDVFGLILLDGAATGLKEALYYQNNLVADEAESTGGFKGAILSKTAKRDKLIAHVDALFKKCRDSGEDTVRFQTVKMPAKWIREHEGLTSEDYASKIKAFGKPVLAITGTADVQADYRQLDLIRDATNVECYAPENMDHILKEVDGPCSILDVKKQYKSEIGKPMHAGAESKLHDWLISVM